MPAARLVLASASPRRAEILASLGIAFRVTVSGVDERLLAGESGAGAAERLARAKALAVSAGESLPVLGADTVVVCGDEVLGKPQTPAEAAGMLRRLAGREHDVITGVCLVVAGQAVSGRERTVVRFAPMSEPDIAAYVATGEPMDKAGAYHVVGRGAQFIAGIDGSPSNVAGLPVRLVFDLARRAGLALA